MQTLTISLLAAASLGILGGPAYAGGDEVELDEAEVFIEFNSTDEDFGIQFFWDGEPWKTMKVGIDGQRPVLWVKSRKNLADQGLTEGFFESAEPDLEELSMEEFFERFPEGEYEFEGKTLEGDEIEGETEFTHSLPAPPTGLFPNDGAVVDAAAPLTASFQAVTTDLDGEPLEPELYELILEIEEDDLLRVFSMVIDGEVEHPAVDVPAQFLQPGGEYKLEIIVQEESGNRTIAEVEFSTL